MIGCNEVLLFSVILVAGSLCIPSNRTTRDISDSVKVEDYFDEEFFQIVPKRTIIQGEFSRHTPLPWSCAQEGRWRILGESYYPSRIRETQCLSSTCWFEHYNCTMVRYSALILHHCTERFCNDHRVPLPLRSRWKFTNVLVQVGCMCTR